MNRKYFVPDKYVHEAIMEKQKQRAKITNINAKSFGTYKEELEYMEFLYERRNGLL